MITRHYYGKNREAAEETVTKITSLGAEAFAVQANVSEVASGLETYCL